MWFLGLFLAFLVGIYVGIQLSASALAHGRVPGFRIARRR